MKVPFFAADKRSWADMVEQEEREVLSAPAKIMQHIGSLRSSPATADSQNVAKPRQHSVGPKQLPQMSAMSGVFARVPQAARPAAPAHDNPSSMVHMDAPVIGHGKNGLLSSAPPSNDTNSGCVADGVVNHAVHGSPVLSVAVASAEIEAIHKEATGRPMKGNTAAVMEIKVGSESSTSQSNGSQQSGKPSTPMAKVILFGGVDEPAKNGIRSSKRIGAQLDADVPQMERAQLLAQRRNDYANSGYPLSCALAGPMVPIAPGGSAEANGVWLQPTPYGYAGLLLPGYWMAPQF